MITRARRFLAYGLLAAIMGGLLFCIVMGKDLWPFSNYPMYAQIRTGTWSIYELHGVPKVPAVEEFRIPRDELPIVGWRNHGIVRLATRALSDPGAEPELHSALRAVGPLYEECRERGQISTPSLAGIRLYRRTFARDQSEGRFELRPLERTLVAEVSLEDQR